MNRAERRALRRSQALLTSRQGPTVQRLLTSTPLRIAGVGTLISSGLLFGYLGNRSAAYASPTNCSGLVPGGISSDDSLDLAIQQVNLGHCNVIDISQGFIVTSDPYPIDADRISTLTITATTDDSVLDGGSVSRGLRISTTDDTDLTLYVTNLTLRHFNDSTSGALAAYAGGSLSATLDDVVLSNNYSLTRAGGAYFQADEGLNILVTGTSSFTDDSSLFGPGALQIEDHPTQVDSLTIGSPSGQVAFARNTSLSAHGGSVAGEIVTITHASFTDDSAALSGGSVYATGTVTANDSTFTGNQTAQWGGAIQAFDVVLDDDTFIDNRATNSNGQGGAVNIDNTVGTTSITDSTFTGNRSTQYGGAVRTLGSIYSLRSTFSDDSSFRGGAIAADDTLTLVSSTFADDTASDAGGAVLSRLAGVISQHSTFTSNVAGIEGGAVLTATTVTSADDTFTGNRASRDDGGAIKAGGGVVIANSRFTGNHAVRDGGAVWATRVTDTGSEFRRNSALQRGGAIRNPGPGQTDLTNSLFADDSASTGGAVESHGLLQATTSTFTDDTASLSGGAIYAHGGIDIVDSTFTSNTAGQNGGGIITRTTTYNSIAGSTFSGNRANGSVGGEGGGAILADDTLTVSDSIFTGNIASHAGGAIYGKNVVSLESNTFAANRALIAQGGAVASGALLATQGSTFVANDSAQQGGAAWAWGNVTSEDDSFTGNRSLSDVAGAIWGHQDIETQGSTFTGNRAHSNGGAVFSDWTAHIYDSTFTGNTSRGSGGAVHADDTLTIASSTFEDDTARFAGGAINGLDIDIRSSSFIRNEGNPGGVAFVRRSVTATNSTFAENSSPGKGGVFYFDGGTTTPSDLIFSTFLGNTAYPNQGSVIVVANTRTPIRLTGTVMGGMSSLCFDDSNAVPSLNLASGSRNSFTSDTSCGGGSGDDSINTAYSSIATLGFDDTAVTTDDTPGAQVIYPDDTSVLVNAAPITLAPGVTRDQLGAPRNAVSGLTTVGAVQVSPLAITGQPQSATVNVGSSAAFTVSSAAGTGGPTSYQWQSSIDGLTWSSIPGAGTATLTLNAVPLSSNGLRIRAIVSDARSTLTSDTAVLTVLNPTPVPGTPPSVPRNPQATSGERSATITWSKPVEEGSFPITTYQVRNDVDGKVCLVSVGSATPLECTISGLTNGRAYRFSVRALNGAGWGSWSSWTDAVVPGSAPTITIVGSRTGTVAQAYGVTTGLSGKRVRAMVKVQAQIAYTPGSAPLVDDEGHFMWSRDTRKKVYVYFTRGEVRSNRVIIPAAQVRQHTS